MPEFKGFPEGKVHLVPIPASFFRELLPGIDHLGELKTILYFFWQVDRMEGPFRFLRQMDLITDIQLRSGFGRSTEEAIASLQESLQRAVMRGALLEVEILKDDLPEKIYFLNSPKGRAALKAIKDGKWMPSFRDRVLASELVEQPNIFRLYEENIGALTPMISEALKDAEESYPLSWIEDAIQLAVENNKRNLRYALAILERWRREGKDGKKEKPEDRPDSEEARRRYVEGEFSDFVEH